ncbi:MAG: hypothetical protein V4685_08065 [Bacteroidota bacterium]
MWQPLQDCGKQLTTNSRLREKRDDGYRLYEITEVEYDQYHLHLLSNNDKPTEDISQVLNGAQLIEYGFEVEVKE